MNNRHTSAVVSVNERERECLKPPPVEEADEKHKLTIILDFMVLLTIYSDGAN